jgi:hypothetical protein
MVVAELRMSQSLVEKFLWVLGFFCIFIGFGVLWFLWVLRFYGFYGFMVLWFYGSIQRRAARYQ